MAVARAFTDSEKSILRHLRGGATSPYLLGSLWTAMGLVGPRGKERRMDLSGCWGRREEAEEETGGALR